MTHQAGSRFVYVTYIRTTPEALWSALTDPERVPQYWLGGRPDTDWKVGSPWRLILADGRVADTGSIVECDPPHRLAIRWRHVLMPELREEGDSLCTLELEPINGAVRLTVTHSLERAPSKFIAAVSTGWPQILSNLKSLLETGAVVLATPAF